jgi:hypothetical protein
VALKARRKRERTVLRRSRRPALSANNARFRARCVGAFIRDLLTYAWQILLGLRANCRKSAGPFGIREQIVRRTSNFLALNDCHIWVGEHGGTVRGASSNQAMDAGMSFMNATREPWPQDRTSRRPSASICQG